MLWSYVCGVVIYIFDKYFFDFFIEELILVVGGCLIVGWCKIVGIIYCICGVCFGFWKMFFVYIYILDGNVVNIEVVVEVWWFFLWFGCGWLL